MKEWKCVNVECGLNCLFENGEGKVPARCPLYGPYQAKWESMQDKALPKLTAEVFDRPDCPAWANWAAVDKDGLVFFYRQKPYRTAVKWHSVTAGDFRCIGYLIFDPTDWQNSLIERPAVLPDWCKVGEWVYDKAINKYSQVAAEDITEHLQEVCKSISKGEIVQSRIRPYNAKEMRGLVGRVVDKKDGDAFVVAAYTPELDSRKLSAVCIDDMWVTPDAVLEYFTIDGQPCGKLEHLEDGEWVE